MVYVYIYLLYLISVVLPSMDIKASMNEHEEMEDIKRYDEANKSKEPSIPTDNASKMIELNAK